MSNPTQDLVKTQKNVATLNHLIANYNQLYKTYMQQADAEANKRAQRKYPYNITNPNEFKNSLTPASPFPSNGTEAACFKSCVDSEDCVYALYSNTGCGIDCNPNKCLLFASSAGGIAPVKELPFSLPSCPSSQPSADQNSNCASWADSGECEKNPGYMLSACAASCNSSATDAWCKTFNHPATNSIIPALAIRTGEEEGGGDWRSLAMQMPKATVNAADAPMTVDLTTDMQIWGPDAQFSDVNTAPANEISLQFRFFAEYWLNAYNLMSGSAPVVAGQGPIGTFAFARLTKPGSDDSTSYTGIFAGQIMFWNSAEPSSGGAAAGQKTAAALATTSESAKFNYNYSAFEKPGWKVAQNMNAMSAQLPPQLAGMSIPSWQFLGVHDSAQACQRAATDDPAHVFSLATYYNASYNNPKNGNSAFARMCYGHVAGAPISTASSSAQDDNAQTMTPTHGFTKLGGKNGITILKKMYQLNQQIVALTEDLKISSSSAPNHPPVKEAFAQKGDADADAYADADAQLAALSRQFKTDEANLNAAIQSYGNLDTDEKNAQQLLLQSRIKFGVALVVGLALAYFAFRVLTADELPSTIQAELDAATASSTSTSNLDMDSSY
jgi:hypothetical protein